MRCKLLPDNARVDRSSTLNNKEQMEKQVIVGVVAIKIMQESSSVEVN